MTRCDIHHSEHGDYYEMLVDGQFAGNFDTVNEAAEEFDRMLEEDRKEAKAC